MDRDLVLRAQAGDQGAFSMLAESIVDRLLAVARGVLGDAHLAEDATQQALLSIWRELPKLREPDTFGAWSYRVLVNACYSEARRAKRWRASGITDMASEPATHGGYGEVLDRDEIERVFEGLSMDHRAAIVMHHYLGMTLPQISRALDIPEGTVRSRLFHAMRKLRDAMGDADRSLSLGRDQEAST
jgi:RNA polymerase sigma-70 factor, ECF subfamily